MSEPWDRCPSLRVSIAPDRMEAFVSASSLAGGEGYAPPDREALLAYLSQVGVSHGLIEERIDELRSGLGTRGWACERLLVARGTPPTPGRDGQVTFCFGTEAAAGRLVDAADEQSAMDLRERGVVQNVKAGAELALVDPAEAGGPGVDVGGRRLPARKGLEPKVPRAGKNVTRTEDGRRFLAAVDGHASLEKGVLRVSTEFLVHGDVGYEVGNIDFVGTVRVKGRVLPGFRVRAGGDVHVGGDVERGAVVEAAGDAVVGRTIVTGDEGVVRAGGTVRCRGIENGRAESDGDVVVSDLVLNGHVRCRGRLIVEAGGHLRGANVEAVGGIDVHDVGSEGGAPSLLVAGLTLATVKRLKAIQAEMKELTTRKEHIFHAFQAQWGAALRDRATREAMTPEERARLEESKLEAGRRQETADARIHVLKEEKRTLEERVHEVKGATITIRGTLYPPCQLSVGEGELGVHARLQSRLVYFADEKTGAIRFRPLQGGARGGAVAEGDKAETDEEVDGLLREVGTRKITPGQLEDRLESFGREPQAAGRILRVGTRAISDRRYQTGRLLRIVGRAYSDVGNATTEAGVRKKIADRALDMLSEAVKKNPRDIGASMDLAEYHLRFGRVADALKTFEPIIPQVRRLAPRDAESNGILLRYADALLVFAEDPSRNPASSRAAFTRALDQIQACMANDPRGETAERCRELLRRLRDKDLR